MEIPWKFHGISMELPWNFHGKSAELEMSGIRNELSVVTGCGSWTGKRHWPTPSPVSHRCAQPSQSKWANCRSRDRRNSRSRLCWEALQMIFYSRLLIFCWQNFVKNRWNVVEFWLNFVKICRIVVQFDDFLQTHLNISSFFYEMSSKFDASSSTFEEI